MANSDTDPNLVSEEMETFLKSNRIKHVTSSPNHAKTNGLTDHLVQTFKQAMKSTKSDSWTLQTKLSKFLIMYCNMVHTSTGERPLTLFLGRTFTTRLDLLKPNLSEKIVRPQSKMVRSTVDRQYNTGLTFAV